MRNKVIVFGILSAIIFFGVTTDTSASTYTWISKKYNFKDQIQSDHNLIISGIELNLYRHGKVERIPINSNYLNYLNKLISFFEDSFENLGYKIKVVDELKNNQRSYLESETLKKIWSQITEYSNSKPNEKSRKEPYFIDIEQWKSAYFDNEDRHAVFIQVFGDYKETNPNDDMARSLAVGAVTGLLTGVAVFPGSEGSGALSFKLSVYDAENGQMIWYQEGQSYETKNDTDVFLRQNVKDFIDRGMEAPENPYKESKFKRKRREMR